MMKRLSAIVISFAAVALLALPAGANYPPSPGADCAATGIQSDNPMHTRQWNGVGVPFENHGTVAARCRVTLRVRLDGTRRRGAVRPGSFLVTLQPGETALAAFSVRPPVDGVYELTACATARRSSRTPGESGPADDCVQAFVTSS